MGSLILDATFLRQCNAFHGDGKPQCDAFHGGEGCAVMVWAESTTLWSRLHSCALEFAYEGILQPVRIHSTVHLQKFVRVFNDKLNHFKLLTK